MKTSMATDTNNRLSIAMTNRIITVPLLQIAAKGILSQIPPAHTAGSESLTMRIPHSTLISVLRIVTVQEVSTNTVVGRAIGSLLQTVHNPPMSLDR